MTNSTVAPSTGTVNPTAHAFAASRSCSSPPRLCAWAEAGVNGMADRSRYLHWGAKPWRILMVERLPLSAAMIVRLGRAGVNGEADATSPLRRIQSLRV